MNVVEGGYACFLNDYGCAEYISSKSLIRSGQLKNGVRGITVVYAGKMAFLSLNETKGFLFLLM